MVENFDDKEHILLQDEEMAWFDESKLVIRSDRLLEIDPLESSRLLVFITERFTGHTMLEDRRMEMYSIYISVLYNYIKYYAKDMYNIFLLDKNNEEDKRLERYYSKFCDSIDFYDFLKRT
jgi:hypothetical protein